MSNTITNVVPKLLAQGLVALRENAVTARLVNRSYENMASMRGNVVNVPIPSAITARDVTPGVTQATNQDASPTVAVVTLDFWKEATFQLSDSDMLAVMEGTIPMQASEAIKSLANAVDSYILGKHTGFFGFTGTAGTTPFATNISAAGTARKLLNKQLAPQDNRVGILDPDAEANFLELSNVLQVDQRGDQGGIINGSIGRKLGTEWFMNQNIPEYTPGTGWVTGFAASTVAGAIGDTTLNVINATSSGTVLVGDIFSVGGYSYVITTAATASSTVALALSFYPALKAAVATGAAVTVLGTTAYDANLVMHRDAMAWASRPLADIEGHGNPIGSAVDPVSGIALRLEVSRQYKQTTWAFDILGGANVVRRELGVKIIG